MSRATVATIHLGALRRNLARVRELSKGAKVMAVVKADGYGHGLERVARALGAADAFGVAALGDGLRLRAAGITGSKRRSARHWLAISSLLFQKPTANPAR